MKKTIAMLLALCVAGTFAGCAKQDKPTSSAGTSATQSQNTSAGSSASSSSSSTSTDSLSAMIDSIYAQKDPEITVQTTEIDLADANAVKSYTGLTDVSGVSQAVASEAMIGSQAYSLVLVKVKNSADAEKTATAMKDGIDPRKWVCVEADDLAVAYKGDIVMLIMMQSDFENISAADIVDAFKKVNGGALDGELTN